MSVPTFRGPVDLSFSRPLGDGQVFALNLTIPGNTRAEVCLPAPLLSAKPQVAISVGGGPQKQVTPVTPPSRLGHVCLPGDLGGGRYAIEAH